MEKIKQADVAGMFYPGEEASLRQMVDGFIQKALSFDLRPRAIIAPHAGYIYSGSIAGTAYKTIAAVRDQIENVIIMSPAHRFYLRGIALHMADAFATPLGNIPVNIGIVKKIKQFSSVQWEERSFIQEHGLETHLPFIQRAFKPGIKIVPMIVGECQESEVAEILESVWEDPRNFVIISSDLSHFHSYADAKKLDRNTVDLIQNLDSQSLDTEFACGHYPICGLLNLARNRKLKIKALDIRSSGDTAGSKESVVGYGSFAVY